MLFSATEVDLAKLREIESTVKYLSIDPGESNGVCCYDENCKLLYLWTVKEEDILIFLNEFNHLNTCIIEDFILYSHKAYQQVGSNMLTSRVIGRTEGWAARKEVHLVKQKAAIKPTGYKFLGRKPLNKKHPMNHALDAHVHFTYWAVQQRKIDLADVLRNESPDTLK